MLRNDMSRLALLLLLAVVPASVSAQSTTDVVCSYAPSQSKTVAAISGAAGGAGASISAVSAATGLTVVTHSSGAAILTGSAGYVAGTLGTAAAAPVIVGVSLFVGGVAVTVELVCANKNHPDQVAKVQEAATEFSRRFSDAMQSTKIVAGNLKKTVTPAARKTVFEIRRTGQDVWEYVYRKSADIGASLGK
jgi:hypothetical protein